MNSLRIEKYFDSVLLMHDDNSLIERIQNGEAELFSVLYEKYCHKIVQFLFYKCNNMSQAQDLAGDSFLKAFDAMSSFRPKNDKSFSSWLYTIATNTFLDSVKKKKESSLDEIEYMVVDADAPDMTHTVQMSQQAEEILDYLTQLGEDKKELFVMRIWQELSREEIEQVM